MVYGKNAELKSDADRWTAVTYYVLLQRCVYRTFPRRPVWRMRVGGPGSGPWRCNEAGEPTLERASVIKRVPRHECVIFNRESLFSKIIAPCRQMFRHFCEPFQSTSSIFYCIGRKKPFD